MIYVISDTHFSHNNIIRYCDRPYENTIDMDNDIINKWNAIVQPDDIVLHLGDVGFGMVEQLSPIIHKLNGKKFLLRGNHDYRRGVMSWTNIGFLQVYKNKTITLQTFKDDLKSLLNEDLTLDLNGFDDIIFSHCPIECSSNILNIHGHIHNVPLDTEIYTPENHFCASIEVISYQPILLQNILNSLHKKE